ncbi:phosphotransferase [Shewanella avicenniae]|uniref:Phosphotransferase n=1 Tax=Shewanella avicenniae TaxID=2814294 RepID=A0ABX7QMN7_9GAMM|nr:phosphotransferase [Shewanella avicenniae]QSX32260.1 phosphotransferase [Shewanella avicenniae]
MLSVLLDFCEAAELARLQAALDELQFTPLLLTQIEQGLSNHSFKLAVANTSNKVPQDLLLRINSPVTDAICSRDNEIACWRAAEQAGLAPTLVWIDAGKRFYLAEWIDESSTELPELLPWRQFAANTRRELVAHFDNAKALMPTEQRVVDKLLQLLLGLRQLPAPALDISVAQQWDIYLTRLAKMAAEQNFPPPVAAAWLARLTLLQQFAVAPIFDALANVLHRHQYCHRDLSAANLLFRDNQLYCIDFEYCCSSHPLFELAGVIATHQLSPAAQQQLLHRYLFEHPNLTADAIKAMPAAFAIFWLYSCAWALQMVDRQCKDAATLFSWFDNYLQLVGK